MASDVVRRIEQQSKDISDLLASIKKELDADTERHAQLQTAAAAAGEVLQDGQSGVTIDLSKTNLRALPVEAIELMRDRVERLAVSHNPQIHIPSEIIQCERLRYLNIRWNGLTDFPDAVLQLAKLEILDLSRNRLTTIPEDIKKLTSLKFLAVARNRITRLPLTLGDMSSLGKLKFDENPLEYPPPEVYHLSPEQSSAHETERDKDICQRVKRFLRTATVKQRLMAFSEDDVSEDHVETPRPPKRSITAGRFPIRPSISGMDTMTEVKVDSPSETSGPPPIPQRSHARVESTTSSTTKRPGIAPLLTNGTEATRSRSETVTSSVSLRQRRQGFVPTRKPAGDLASVTEDSAHTNQPGTTRSTHARGKSSVSTVSSAAPVNSADTSGTASPNPMKSTQSRKQNSLSDSRNLRAKSYPAHKVSSRIVDTFTHLTGHVNSVVLALTDGAPQNTSLGTKFFAAQSQVYELGRELGDVVIGNGAKGLTEPQVTLRVTTQAVAALKAYGVFLSEMNRRSAKCVRCTEGYKLRPFLLNVHGTLIELRNALPLLGVKVLERGAAQERPRTSRAWSSKSVTPTQPKAPIMRRMPRPPMLQGVGNNAMPRPTPVPPVPTRPDLVQPNAIVPAGVVHSGEPYASAAMVNPVRSRTNTLRSFPDDSEGDLEFDKIAQKLQAACAAVSQALPLCRREFQVRKESAQNNDNRSLAQHWAVLITKTDEIIGNTKTLRKRLNAMAIGETGLRHQREFWQLCDIFVLSWTEFATEIRNLSQQRVDINSIKHLMRSVQRPVKDVSRMIYHSKLYQDANPNRAKPKDSSAPSSAVSPNPLGWSHSHGVSKMNNGYATSPLPSTPHSATYGPGMPTFPVLNGNGAVAREYYQEPPTARRYDTPVQYQQHQYPRRQ